MLVRSPFTLLVRKFCVGSRSSLEQVIDRFSRGGCEGNCSIYASLVRSCSDNRALVEGRKLHELIVRDGYEHSLLNHLIHMYIKCCCINEAQTMFERSWDRDVVLWTAMLGAYAEDQPLLSLQYFRQMQLEGVMPNKITFIAILNACGNPEMLEESQKIHRLITELGLDSSNVMLGNALINMYGKCGRVECGRQVFQAMDYRDVISWNSMIGLNAHNGDTGESFEYFLRMQLQGVAINRVTFLSVLGACSSPEMICQGKLVHAIARESGFEYDLTVGNCLLNMYAKCGSFKEALKMFHKIPEANLVSWNAVISIHTQQGQNVEAVRAFQRTLLEGMIPDNITFVNVLHAFNCREMLASGMLMHKFILDNSKPNSDSVLETAIVNMYAKCGSPENAQASFDTIDCPSVVAWTTLIYAYADHGKFRRALQTFMCMLLEGKKPGIVTFISILYSCSDSSCGKILHGYAIESGCECDEVVQNAVASMYGRCGSLEDTSTVFEKMYKRKAGPWNVMMGVCVDYGQYEDAIVMFRQMQLEGVAPEKITFVAVLDACTSVKRIKWVHGLIAEVGLERDVVLTTSLVDLYGKMGSVEDSLRIFEMLQNKDVVCWNTMISAHGNEDGLQLFCEMQLHGVKPDLVTLVTVTNICSSSEDYLAMGKQAHSSAEELGLDLNVGVATSLVNMYAKCGKLDEARRVFEKAIEVNQNMWAAIIVAYEADGLTEETNHLFRLMLLQGDRPNKSCMVAILNTCRRGASNEAKKLMHVLAMESGLLDIEEGVAAALIVMYLKSGDIDAAIELFTNGDGVHRGSLVLWTALISAMNEYRSNEEALHWFHEMLWEGIWPNRVTFLALLSSCSNVKVIRWLHSCCIVEAGLEIDDVIGAALMTLYTKCGKLKDASGMFEKLVKPDAVSWTAMMTAYTHHGHTERGLDMFEEMVNEGLMPDAVTLMTVLSACSHVGYVERGYNYLMAMEFDYGIHPVAEHYGCMVDVLGRAGRLDDAQSLMESMPFQPGVVVLSSLLAASKTHQDVRRGEVVAKCLMELDRRSASTYMLLSAAAGT